MAREQIRELITPTLRQVVTYRAGLNRGFQREVTDERMYGDDYVLASEVLLASAPLPLPRRWLVRRRCSRLFGPFIAELAEMKPADPVSLGNVLAPLIVAGQSESRLGQMSHSQRFGTLHESSKRAPDHPDVRRLERDLKRLAAGW